MSESKYLVLAILLVSVSCCLAQKGTEEKLTDENDAPLEPFVSEKAELFRFSRSANKGGLFAKYEQRQQELQRQREQEQLLQQQQQQQQQQQHQQQQQQQQQDEQVQSQAEVNRDMPVAAEAPAFSSVLSPGSDYAQRAEMQPNPSPESSSSSSSPLSSSKSSNSNSKSSLSKTVKITTTTTTIQQHPSQEQPHVARLQQVRVHTVPLSQAVHYANYVLLPGSAGSNKAARLEEASSSSSSSSSQQSSSSSSSAREETESVAVAQPQPPPVTTVVLPPVSASADGPDCHILQRLIVERPVSSGVFLTVPSEIGVSQSSSSSSSSQRSSRVVEQAAVEPPAVVPPVCCLVKKTSVPVYTAKLVAPAANDGHLKEEHFHSESRSSREESHGLGSHSSSSSSSSSSSRTSKSSSSTTSQQTAALVAAPVPPLVTYTTHHRPITVVKASAPLVAYAPPSAQNRLNSNSYSSVDVDHHYTGPNVKYGYSIKQHQQQHSEPESKGLLVGERVVYLK